jgi:hypothetical protein
VAIYGIMPWDSWDSQYPIVDEVPLWTLYYSPEYYIAVVADIANSKMLFRVVNDGALSTIDLSPVKYWRCHPVDVCISTTDDGVEVSARVVGDIKTNRGAYQLGVAPTEIRFGSPDWSRVTALDVAHINIEDSFGFDGTGRASWMAEAAGLDLVSAYFDENENQLLLQFDRPVDISGIQGAQMTLKAGTFNNSEYSGTTASLIDSTTVLVSLQGVGSYSATAVQLLTITSLNGIKFVADGAPFRGVSELSLPY